MCLCIYFVRFELYLVLVAFFPLKHSFQVVLKQRGVVVFVAVFMGVFNYFYCAHFLFFAFICVCV